MEQSVKREIAGDGIWIEVDLSVPPERAWTLLAEKQHRANWWGDHVELEVKPGGKFVETWSDAGRQRVTAGEVTRCDPPSRLEMTWADDDWPGATDVAFHLTEHADGTRLVLEHSGWDVHPPEKRQKLIDAHVEGWSRYLERLADYATAITVLRRLDDLATAGADRSEAAFGNGR